MVELSYRQIGGILSLIIILSTGITLVIQDAGTKTGCRAGWIKHNETHHKCITQRGERYEMCFEIYNSANTENYWCKRGQSKEEIEEKIVTTHRTGRYIICNGGCKDKEVI